MINKFLIKWCKFANANPLSYMFLFAIVILLIVGIESLVVI